MKRIICTLAISFCLIFQMACGAGTLSKLHDALNKASRSLNAAAKTNRSFYEGGIYGVTGSPEAIALRQKAATVIHDSNEKLIVALNLAKDLTAETFETGKIGVLTALAAAASMLSTGNQNIDLVLQTVAALIQNAVAIIQSVTVADLLKAKPFLKDAMIPFLEIRKMTVV